MAKDMIWTARQADAATVARLRANPEDIGAFVSGMDVDEDLLDAPADVHNDDLRERYDPKAMVKADVYYAKALVEEGAGAIDFIVDDVDRLRSFLSEGADRGLAALAMIN